MKFHRLFTEDRAVSPVIGVILMVAITVILAAVIGTFVLGIAPDDDPAPSVQLTFSAENDTHFNIHHQGGNTLDLGELTVLVDDVQGEIVTDGPISAGERAMVNSTLEGLSEDHEWDIRVRHDPTGSVIGSDNLEIGESDE